MNCRELTRKTVLIVLLLVAAGCNRSTSSGDRQAGAGSEKRPEAADDKAAASPDESRESSEQSPEAAVQAMLDAVDANRPDVLWNALPAGYRADVTDLVHDFAARMDAQLWQQMFKTLTGVRDVLRTRQDAILSYPPLGDAENVDVDMLAARWESIVGLADTLLGSEIADLEKFETLDVGNFLAGTGRTAMRELSSFTENRFSGARAEIVSVEGDSAVVRIVFREAVDRQPDDRSDRTSPPATPIRLDGSLGSPGVPSQEYAFVRVEGKWVPRQLAANWDDGIAAAKTRLSQWSPEAVEFQTQQWLPILLRMDSVTEQLQAAESDDEFHALLTEQIVEPVRNLLVLTGAIDGPVTGAADEPPSAKAREAGTVTVVFEEALDAETEAQVVGRLMELVDVPEFAIAIPAIPQARQPRIEVGPVSDIEAFADRIEFGEVTGVDAENRVVTVRLPGASSATAAEGGESSKAADQP